MSYQSYSSSQYSPPSHSSSLSSSSARSHSSYSTHSNIAVARYEAAKSFDLEDDLEYCPALSLDEVRLYYDDMTAKSMFFPNVIQHSPPSQSATPSPPNTHIHPSPPQQTHRLIMTESQTPVFRPPSRGRGTAAIKIIDPTTREERRRQFY